ncbi:3-oxoadipate enol-lactonase [Achromobacter sp. F4_2707]
MIDTISLSTRNGVFRVAERGPKEAPVLLLSNSLGTTLEMWAEQLAVFSETYRVVCYDTRGHGGSPVTPGPYSFDLLGEDVLSIMDALNVDKAAICGVSMGGHTALWLAANAAERFTGIAVCNSAAKIGTAEAWGARAATVRESGKDAMQALAASSPERWFSANFINAEPDLVARAQAWIASINPEGYAACCEALATSDLRDKLAGIKLPTLLVAGEYDPVTTVADAEFMRQAIAGSQLVSVPASHLSNIEAPQAFNQALASFLSSLG